MLALRRALAVVDNGELATLKLFGVNPAAEQHSSHDLSHVCNGAALFAGPDGITEVCDADLEVFRLLDLAPSRRCQWTWITHTQPFYSVNVQGEFLDRTITLYHICQ